MMFAACSFSRRCWSCASLMACSSWTFGSALSSNFPVSRAVVYRHHRLKSLIMRLSLSAHGILGWATHCRTPPATCRPQRRLSGLARRELVAGKTGPGPPIALGERQPQRLELVDDLIDARAHTAQLVVVPRQRGHLDGAGDRLGELGLEHLE